MIQIGKTKYNVVYIDTNILRATLEMSENIHLNTLLYLGKKSIFAISVLTLVEISHRNDLLKSFMRFLDSIPMLILKPSHQILEIEQKKINLGVQIDELILLISNPLTPKIKNEIVDFLKSKFFFQLCHLSKNEQTATYERIKKELELGNDNTCTPEEFVQNRINLTIGKSFPLTIGDRNLLSQKIINLLLYYTYKVRKKKAERSDPFDFLISSVVPYVDVFITENSQAKSFNMIKSNHCIIDNVEILVMKDLRGEIK